MTLPHAASAESGIAAPPLPDRARLQGVLFLCTGALVFSLQDVIIKGIAGTYPVAQVLAIRSVVAFLPLLLLLRREGGLRTLRSRRRPLLLFRGLCLFSSYTAYYLAIAALPLAEVVALFYAAPLIIVALSAGLLGERIGIRPLVAVAVGFVGVLVICRPGQGVLDLAALLALGAAAVYALGQVLARDLGRTDPASCMAFYHNCVNLGAALLLGLVAGDGGFAGAAHPSLAFLLRAWVVPSLPDLLLMAATGLIAGIASWCLVRAYSVTEANAVAPFEYTAITWAVLWGLLLWGEIPGLHTVLGVALIVGAGVHVLGSRRRNGA